MKWSAWTRFDAANHGLDRSGVSAFSNGSSWVAAWSTLPFLHEARIVLVLSETVLVLVIVLVIEMGF